MEPVSWSFDFENAICLCHSVLLIVVHASNLSQTANVQMFLIVIFSFLSILIV